MAKTDWCTSVRVADVYPLILDQVNSGKVADRCIYGVKVAAVALLQLLWIAKRVNLTSEAMGR